MKFFICFFLIIFSSTNAWKCPTHCFCYTWKNMMRTDCVGKNLYNTYVSFSHETQVLDLSRNAISILHGNEFLDANLKALNRLILHNNRLNTIDKLSFNGLVHLEYLDLSYNFIQYLDPNTFKFNPNLNVLNLSNNPLTLKKDEPFLSHAPSLQVLNLANNDLRSLTDKTFCNLEKLQELNLSNNHILKIKQDTFEVLRELKFLDFSENDLICNDESIKFLEWLQVRRIEFRPFCQSEKFAATKKQQGDTNLRLKELTVKNLNDTKNIQTYTLTKKSFYENVVRSIPTLYTMLWGIQIGILLGALFTYLCLRKATKSEPLLVRTRSQRSRVSVRSSRFENTDPDHSTIALVPLNTPPGTPPSPYHSRLTLPSNFTFNKPEDV